MSPIVRDADLFRVHLPAAGPVKICVVEPSGSPRPLDDILPWRNNPLPPAGDSCQSCGHHLGTCLDDCC